MNKSDDLLRLVELLERLTWLPVDSFETFDQAENALSAYGIRIMSRNPLQLEWVDPAHGWASHSPPPTLLVSPNGFAILDALFSKTDEELSDYRSMLEFARENGLSQPKLSRFKSNFRAADLKTLRSRLRSLPFENWVRAFDYPNTAKGMTSFFRVVRAYTSAAKDPDLGLRRIHEFFDAHELVEGRDWVPGPTRQLLGSFQALVETAENLWVTEAAEKKLKQHLRLVPALRSYVNEPKILHLARAKHGFEKEAIVRPGNPFSPNRFRTVWDLLRGEARIREVGLEYLREILGNEA